MQPNDPTTPNTPSEPSPAEHGASDHAAVSGPEPTGPTPTPPPMPSLHSSAPTQAQWSGAHLNANPIGVRNLVTMVAIVGITVGLALTAVHVAGVKTSTSAKVTPKPGANTSGTAATSTTNKSVGVVTPAPGVTTSTGPIANAPAAIAGNRIYLSPASANPGVGQTVTVEVRENSGATAVNAVQANFTYPTARLQFVSISADGSAFPVQAENSGASGQVKIARGTTTPVSGDQLLAKVTFKVTATGSAPLDFNTGTALASSTTHGNVLGATTGATYTLK